MREPGYYFVKWKDCIGWDVAYNDGSELWPWSACGNEEGLKDSDISVIGDEVKFPQ